MRSSLYGSNNSQAKTPQSIRQNAGKDVMKATEIIATINDNMTMTEVTAIVEQAKAAAKEETAAAKKARIEELLALKGQYYQLYTGAFELE